MSKRKISNIASSAFLIAGGVFALQVLISNVSAVTNRINMSDEKEADYISGIMDQNNTKDEVDALFVGDVCIFSESGYFDNVVGKNGYADKDAKKVRINCDGTVPGVTFDKSTRTLALDGYTGNEKIIYFDTKKSAKDDFNIKVYGENKVKEISFYEYVSGEKNASVNISGGGTLNLNGSLWVDGNGYYDESTQKYHNMVDTNISNVIINIPEEVKVKINDDEDQFYYPSLSAYNLELNNVKFSGSLHSSLNLIMKNGDFDLKKNSYLFGNISIENSDLKSILKPIIENHRGSDNIIKIKNSNLKIENTNEIPTVSRYGTPLPIMFVDSIYTSPFPIVAWYYGALTESSPNLISVENVKVKDGLNNDLKVVSKTVTFDDEFGSGSYVASIFGTDKTKYNEETEMWEEFPQTVVITAEKPELVGAKITKEDKNNNDSNGEKKNIRPVEKDILEGAGQEMNMNEIKDLVIRYNRDFKLFEKVTMNGKEVPAESYEVKSGSTVLTIKAAYLKNLGAGEHKVAAYFKGEEKPIETTVTLKVKSAGNQGSFTTDEMISSECGLGALFAILSAVMISVGISLKVKGKKTISKRYF